MGESADEANAQPAHLYDPNEEQRAFLREHPDERSRYRCDHFDCACPRFVTDGRVSNEEWGRYVEAMDITYQEQANAKVAFQAGVPLANEQGSDLPLWERGEVEIERPQTFAPIDDVMDGLREVLHAEAENAELNRDALVDYVRRSPAHQEQPAPKPGQGPDIQQLVIGDMAKRYALGVSRYGQGVQAFNGRDMLRDLYEELLDAAVYIRGAMEERDRG